MPTPVPTVFDLHCRDNIVNFDETDVDCGGDDCGPCAVFKECIADSDCQTGLCSDLDRALIPQNYTRRQLLALPPPAPTALQGILDEVGCNSTTPAHMPGALAELVPAALDLRAVLEPFADVLSVPHAAQ